jgi:hypothetical protein
MVVQSPVVTRLAEARDRGVAYLTQRQRDDGALGNPEQEGLGPYYKALWAFAAGGRADAGNRLADWVARNVLTEEGDFSGPMRGTDHDSSYPYSNAWMICGAQKLGRFDISYRGMEFLPLLQHREDGGFRIKRDDESAPQDVLCSAQGGNACLFTGHIAEAREVGRFLRTIWEAQPHPERELFFAYRPGQGLRTDFPDERQRMFSIRVDRTRQRYFNMGIAAAFLVRLAQATGDPEWIALAKSYLQIGFDVLDEMYETAQVGKVGWGAALAHAATGEQKYRQLAERVGEALLAQQTDSGGWDNTGGYTTDAVRAEVTAEFVVLLDEMIGGLA